MEDLRLHTGTIDPEGNVEVRTVRKVPSGNFDRIRSLTISNQTLKAKLEDFLSGKVTKVSEVEILQLISDSEVDKELIRIISNQDPDNMDAIEALEYIPAFFVYIRANKERFARWLGSFGLAVTASPNTPSRGSK